MIKFGLTSEPYELMPKLDKAVEPDYRKMITSSTFDSSSYQIVCNAQIWLLSYFSHISLQACYFDSIVNAVIYIVNQINSYHNIKELNRQELFDFIKFDNINTILGGARANNRPSGAKKLIQRIYSELKPVLGNDYQFNHQHAKCLLWCIEELNESERQIDLKVALQSILLSIRQIEDAIENTPKNRNLKISFAHAQFTLAIIKVKQFFFNKNKETFSNAVLQTFKALQYEENLNAYELTDEATDDENDYSISKFMDYLMEEESSIYRDRYAQQINWIINFRFRHVRNKNQNT